MKNKELGLPFGKMQNIKIAFDVDGTIRCNCTDSCQHPNQRIIDLMFILQSFKNTEIFIWSGGGADYARRFKDKFMLPVKDKRCIGKIGAPQMDIAIDDIQDTAIGKLNLIVREK